MQPCRACGAGASLDAHFCPQCRTILPLNRRQTDYFTFFGLPRKLRVDAPDLEARFRALSRQFHPDFFYNAPTADRRASLERSSYLNDAYRTLKSPVARVEYLLDLEERTAKSPEEASKQVPAGLLEEVFALNEELDEIRELRAGGAPPDEVRARLERARTPIDAKRAEHERQLEELSARWDESGGPDVLDALRDRVLERNYISNLLAGIERELTS
jgi:molecular chaperone HscB